MVINGDMIGVMVLGKWPKINGKLDVTGGYNPIYRSYFTPLITGSGAHLVGPLGNLVERTLLDQIIWRE